MAAKPKVEFIITARDLTRGAFRRIRRSLGNLKNQLIALVGLGAIAKLATDALRFAKNIKDASTALGTTTTQLQALQDVGREFGIDADDIQDALFSISTARNEAMRGTTDMRESLRRLGAGGEFLRGRDNPLDYLLQISTAVRGAGGDFTRFQADLNRIFGEDVTRRLLPLLRSGPDSIIGQMMDAVTGGRVATEAQIKTGAQALIEAQKALTVANVKALQGTEKVAQGIDKLTVAVEELTDTIKSARGDDVQSSTFGLSEYSP